MYRLLLTVLLIPSSALACDDTIGRFWIGMQAHDQNRDVTMESPLAEIGYELYVLQSDGARLGLTLEHKSGSYGNEFDDGFNGIGIRFALEH